MTTASSEDWAKQNTTSVLLRRTGGYVRDVTCWVASTTHINNATTCPQKPKSQGVPWYQKYGPRGYPGRELDFQVFFFLVGTPK